MIDPQVFEQEIAIIFKCKAAVWNVSGGLPSQYLLLTFSILSTA